MVDSLKHTQRSKAKEKKQLLDFAVVEKVRTTRFMAKSIAEEAGCSEQYVSTVLKRHRPPSDKLLRAIRLVLLRDARERELAAILGPYPKEWFPGAR